ncbi:MAG: glycoside hydrolase family 43 protein [Muribaculaceae bacterium]|nr:glycoside hydrolase family 43 protein [Muribaculaceae bacterium]
MKTAAILLSLATAVAVAQARTMELADPTIMVDGGRYYMYGTSSPSDTGFEVYVSDDLEHWTGPAGKAADGFALHKDDAFGSKWFWAPQVVKVDSIYYMLYTAEEQIAVAHSKSPLGPFVSDTKEALPYPSRRIDPYLLIDPQYGRRLFYVVLDGQNVIRSSEPGARPLHVVQAEPGTWEDTADAQWRVAEGPTVIKHDGKYHLFYSCNDFRNPDYAVGHAVAESPEGPWVKSPRPVIDRNIIGMPGTGHGDIFVDSHGQLRYVFHAHASATEVSPRRTLIVTLRYTGDTFEVVPGSLLCPQVKD